MASLDVSDIRPISNTTKNWQNGTSSKTLDIMLPERTVDERINLFFDFLEVFEEKADPVLYQYPLTFSHGLHWDTLPTVQEYGRYREKYGVEATIKVALKHSFSGENDDFFWHMSRGLEASSYNGPLQRNDLYQIWWPKGMVVRDFVMNSCAALYEVDKLLPNDIMGATRYLTARTKELYPKFVFSSYANKNAVRHISMSMPDVVDPETFIKPGTGSFRGFQQIFGGPNLISCGSLHTKDDDPKLIELKNQFNILKNHPRNIIERQQYINIEDKVCFFFKWLAIHAGWMKGKGSPEKNSTNIENMFK